MYAQNKKYIYYTMSNICRGESVTSTKEMRKKE